MRKVLIPEPVLYEMYVNNEMTTYEIADELGVCRQTVSNKLEKYGIEKRDYLFKKKPKLKLTDKGKKKKYPYRDKDLFEEKYKELKSIKSVANYFNISKDTAYTWKKKHGIETISSYSESGKRKMVEGKPYADKEYLKEMYEIYSSYELAEKWNCHPTTVINWLKRFDIPRKGSKGQWKKSSKRGVRVRNFDLQEYKKAYQLSNNRLSRQIASYIKTLVSNCQSCGYSKVLDIHHIDEDRSNNDPSNHIVLCPNCHAEIHRLDKSVEELAPDYISWDNYQQAK